MGFLYVLLLGSRINQTCSIALVGIIPVFSRLTRATRSRSSICTSSSGGDTPPVTHGFSSMDEGSQSSIDLSQINFSLPNATFPMSTLNHHRIRARAHSHDHRRRASQARASRSPVYETIKQEVADSLSPVKPSPVSMKIARRYAN